MQLTEKQKSEGWRIVKFGDVAQEVKASTKDPLGEGIERYIGLEHIAPESLRLARYGLIAEDNPTFTKKFSVGDILFGRRRAYLKKAAVADFDGICSGDITVIAPKGEDLVPDLLPFIVQSEPFFDWAVKHSAGGLSPRTKFKSLAEFEFPLPPRPRQEEMLEVFEKIEEVLFQSEMTSEALRRAQDIAYGDFFRKLDALDDSSIVGEDLFKLGGGNAPKDIPLKDNGDTNYIKVDCFNDERNSEILNFSVWTFDKDEAHKSVKIYPSGSVIFPKRGAAIFKNRVGILGRDAAVDSNIMVLQTLGDISSEYMRSYLHWRNLSTICDNAGVPQLNNKHLYPMNFPLPDKDDRMKFNKISENFARLQDQLFLKHEQTIGLRKVIINDVLKEAA